MKVKDINFLKESMQKIKCEVIKPKVSKYEKVKEQFKKDGIVEISDKKGEYLYIHNELSINFKIVDENQKPIKEIKVKDYRKIDLTIYKGILYIYDDGKIYEYSLKNLNDVKVIEVKNL